MNKSVRVRRDNCSREFQDITVRSINARLGEEERTSTPRACLAFSALSVWNWIGGKLAGLVTRISLHRDSLNTESGRLARETATTRSTLFEGNELETGAYEDENQSDLHRGIRIRNINVAIARADDRQHAGHKHIEFGD
jgi:hypothetical protein